MKRICFVLTALAAAAAIGLTGCGTTERVPLAEEPFSVDLSLLPQVRNSAPFTRQWDDLIIPFPAGMFDEIDFRAFTRVTIRADYFDADGNLVEPDNDLAMVVLVYDLDRNFGDSPDGVSPGPNSPLRQLHIGGEWGSIHTERGSMMRLIREPAAIVFHNMSTLVRYIEVTEITFHNR